MTIATLLALVLAPAANAQDQEYQKPELDEEVEEEAEETPPLQVTAGFDTEWHEFDNLDFRPLDNSSDQAILDSDDRGSLAFTGASFGVAYQVDPTLKVRMSASHRGLWGNDQFGNVNVFGGFFYFNAMYAEVALNENDNAPVLRIGRQFYELDGGVPSQLEYVLSDVVDQVLADIPLGDVGKLVLVPINVASMGAQDDTAFIGFLGQSQLDTFNFGGDTLTKRTGGQLVLDELMPVDLMVYGFYSDLGALGSGSDITYNGLLGNFSDNDWVANYGARLSGEFGPVKPFFSFDGSMGIDRKELVAEDVSASGFAFLGGAEVETGDEEKGLRLLGSFFESVGPRYSDNGLQYTHGYVGMKGRHAGGTIGNRYLGWHPTAYVGMFGISDMPHDQQRKAGTRVAQASVAYDTGKFTPRVSWWMFQDTGVTDLNFGKLDTITPPFGYSREAFAAQKRMGKALGQEIDIDLNYESTEHVSFYVNGATLLAGEFYEIEVARVAGGGNSTALGKKNPENPVGVYGGTRIRF